MKKANASFCRAWHCERADTPVRRLTPAASMVIIIIFFGTLVGAKGNVVYGRPILRQPQRDGALAQAVAETLPANAILRLGSSAWHCPGTVYSLAFSPDGTNLASAGDDRAIRLWSLQTGAQIACCSGHHGSVYCVAFAPNGKILASASEDMTIRLWDATTGTEVRRLLGHKGPVFSVAFSPDGKIVVSGGVDHTIRMWNTETGQQLGWFTNSKAGVWRVIFSPDGTALASVDAGKSPDIRLWQVKGDGKPRRIWRSPGSVITSIEGITSIDFSPDGKLLAAARLEGNFIEPKISSAVHLWDITSGQEVHKSKAFAGIITSLAFSPDRKSLAWSEYGAAIRVMNVRQWKERLHFNAERYSISTIAFSPSGQVLAGAGNGGAICLWDIRTGKERFPSLGHRGPVLAVACSPDGRFLASGSTDRTIILWDAKTGRAIHTLGGKPYRLLDDPLAFGGEHWDAVSSVCFASNGKRLVSASDDDTVRLWDVATGRHLACFLGDMGRPKVALAPDGKTLATISHHGISLRSLPTGKLLHHFFEALVKPDPWPDPWYIPCLAFAPDGASLAVRVQSGSRSELHVWQLLTRRSELPAELRKSRLTQAFAGVEVPMKPWRRFNVGDGKIQSIAFSLDGNTLAAGADDGLIHTWDLASGHETPSFCGHDGPVLCLAFGPDGKTLASGGQDGTVRLWENITAKERRRFVGHEGAVNSLVFTPDGSRLVSASSDNTLLVWNVLRRTPNNGVRVSKLSTQRLEKLWLSLGSYDGAEAYDAICELALAPEQAVRFLRERVRPVTVPDPERIDQLIRDLDDERFAVRESATKKLRQWAEMAEPALRGTLRGHPSPEVRRRVEELLKSLGRARLPEQVRALRTIEVLQSIGNGNARQILETLARGAPNATVTREAKASLEWLSRRQDKAK